MTYSEFTALVARQPDSVVLLEGRRSIPRTMAKHAERLAHSLALQFPNLRFRSGNAEGADEAFSKGIASVDAGRLQIIAPYPSHRQNVRYMDAVYDSPASLSSMQDEVIAFMTAAASPSNKGLIDKRKQNGRLAAKAQYLMRDTMKVLGHSVDFPKPVCALFYVKLEDPMAGGTGHTIRVCQQEGVPFGFQDAWSTWPLHDSAS